jgi:hypothetical protein
MNQSRNLFIGFLLLLSFSIAFAQKTAITHESMWALKRVGAPIPSPDGNGCFFPGPSRLIVFPEENHWILKGENGRYFYTELYAWLKKWL